jgi:hypothetical protein
VTESRHTPVANFAGGGFTKVVIGEVDCIPQNTRKGILSRLQQRLGKNPFEADDFSTLGELVQFCQFSD